MGEFSVTITDDGKAVLSRKGAGLPVVTGTDEPPVPVQPEGTEVVTPETPTEPADDPKPRRGRASSDE